MIMANDISDIVDELEFLKGSLVLVEQTPYRTPHFKKSMLDRGTKLYQEHLDILDWVKHERVEEYRVWLMTYMIRTRQFKIPDGLDGICIPGTSTVVREKNVTHSMDIGYCKR